MMVHHSGVRGTLTKHRQSYCIPRGREFVKEQLKKCVTCRKIEEPPFRSVITLPFLEISVTGTQPFRVTGVDYAVPSYIRNYKKEEHATFAKLPILGETITKEKVILVHDDTPRRLGIITNLH